MGGIIINGASGTGKTTLGKELASRLDFYHVDLDDYYYYWDTEIPFSSSPSREQIRVRVMEDIQKHGSFVMSGTIGSALWDLVNPLCCWWFRSQSVWNVCTQELMQNLASEYLSAAICTRVIKNF